MPIPLTREDIIGHRIVEGCPQYKDDWSLDREAGNY